MFQSTKRQWRRTLFHYLFLIAISGVLLLLFGRKPPKDVFRIFFWELGILTFFVLFIINREYPFRTVVSQWKLKKGFDIALGCYVAVTLLSSFLSFFPEDSFPQLRKGIIVYLLIYLCISDNIRSFEQFKKVVLSAFLAVFIISLVILIEGVAYPAGSYPVQNWLVRKEAVRLFDPTTLNPLFHVQFPFSHYYKTAYFLAIGIYIIMLQYFITIKRISRQWVAATGIVAFAALALTLSRGAILSVIVSFSFLSFLAKKKYLITLVVLILLLIIFVPGVMREYYMDLFRPGSYTDPSSKVGFYLQRWTIVSEVIWRYPIIGTGYGWKQFEDVCRLVFPVINFESRPHPYSWYLQILCETGMLGLFSFLLFSAFMFFLLLKQRSQIPLNSYQRDINSALVVLFTIPYIVGCVNFTYQGALGLFIWIIYGLCASYLKLTIKSQDINELRKQMEQREKISEDW
jgi:O-antigen ligase